MKARVRVRDRIFETACSLFYSHGINGVGVEMIVAQAGSNKMSFYRSFASKEALVTEYLCAQEREYWAWWEAAVAPYPNDPRRQVEALELFRVIEVLTHGIGLRGMLVQEVELQLVRPPVAI